MNETMTRKLEHIEVVLREDTVFPGGCNEIYSSIKLVHQAMPLVDYDDIDTSVEFLGYTLKAPLMITGITGGHPEATKINEGLARVAEETGIAIGVGSQRAMIEKPSGEVKRSYVVVREIARNVPVVGNIGLNTLQDLTLRDVEGIVDEIKADALAIHLNPAQELIQPEGDTRFARDVLGLLKDIVRELSVPVIIKEVGNGLSMEVVEMFSSIGVEYFDVAGACGTNWVLVEGCRAREKGVMDKALLAEKLKDWGIPTPQAVIEARWVNPKAFIIASGGVWDGVRAAKNIVLGADLNGFARPVLKELLESGVEAAMKYVENYITELRSVMFLVGASSIRDLRRKPFIILDPLKTIVSMRGVDIGKYMVVKTG